MQGRRQAGRHRDRAGRDQGYGRTGHAYPGPPALSPGSDLLPGYAEYLKKLVDISWIRPLVVAVDAGNGMGGHTVPTVFEGLPVTLIPLYFELDGTFPNHEANPIDPENLRDLQQAVREHDADIGLAFDGDADRCFVVDERGEIVSPSVLTALIATSELAREPGATVIHNLITSRAVPELITEHGGIPVRTRVGHSFIKAKMAETNAMFGGEHSGHFYFRDFWFADSGMLAALHTLAALGRDSRPLSQLLEDFARYAASGEINSEVGRPGRRHATGQAGIRDRPGVTTDELDGLTVAGDHLVVQPPPVQHRAAAAAERGGGYRGRRWPHQGRGARPGQGHHRPFRIGRIPWRSTTGCSTSSSAPSAARRCGSTTRPASWCARVRARLPGPRQHPGAAGRRGQAPRRASEHMSDDLAAGAGPSSPRRTPARRPGDVEAGDPGGMLRQVASSAAQVRTALRACAEADLSALSRDTRPRAIVVAGRGRERLGRVRGDALAAICGSAGPGDRGVRLTSCPAGSARPTW